MSKELNDQFVNAHLNNKTFAPKENSRKYKETQELEDEQKKLKKKKSSSQTLKKMLKISSNKQELKTKIFQMREKIEKFESNNSEDEKESKENVEMIEKSRKILLGQLEKVEKNSNQTVKETKEDLAEIEESIDFYRLFRPEELEKKIIETNMIIETCESDYDVNGKKLSKRNISN
jgi:uncharacterized phage infection (PIP) family protein YhgE